MLKIGRIKHASLIHFFSVLAVMATGSFGVVIVKSEPNLCIGGLGFHSHQGQIFVW